MSKKKQRRTKTITKGMEPDGNIFFFHHFQAVIQRLFRAFIFSLDPFFCFHCGNDDKEFRLL